MRTFIKFMVVALTILSSLEINTPANQDDYFIFTQTKKHVLTGIYSSKKSTFAKKLIERVLNEIESHDFFKTHKIETMAADMDDISILQPHYDIRGTFALFYYINNRLQRFGEFDELAQDFLNQKILWVDFSNRIVTWIKSKVDRINAPLKSVEDFNKALAAHKIMGVYLGETSGFYFNQYREFAEAHIDFNFYHAYDNFIADQIFFLKTNLPRPQTENLFTIIRDKSLIDELDSKELVAVDAKRPMEDYEVFFQYEQFPKLREPSYGDDIFFRLYNMNEKLVLYVYNDDSSMDDFNQFKKAVYLLPKVFVFSHINTAHPKFGSYMQMFVQAGQQPTENKVYIIHVHMGHMSVQVVPAQVDADKIVEAVNRFFRQNMLKFTSAERSVLGGDLETQNGDEGEGELAYTEL